MERFIGRKKELALMEASSIFSEAQQRYYYIFAKGGFTDDVRIQAARDCCTLVGIDDLFAIDAEE